MRSVVCLTLMAFVAALGCAGHHAQSLSPTQLGAIYVVSQPPPDELSPCATFMLTSLLDGSEPSDSLRLRLAAWLESGIRRTVALDSLDTLRVLDLPEGVYEARLCRGPQMIVVSYPVATFGIRVTKGRASVIRFYFADELSRFNREWEGETVPLE